MPYRWSNHAYRRTRRFRNPESGHPDPGADDPRKHGIRQSRSAMNSGSPWSKARQPIVSAWRLGTTSTRLASLARRAIGCQRNGSDPPLVATTVASVIGVRIGRSPQRPKPRVDPVWGERHCLAEWARAANGPKFLRLNENGLEAQHFRCANRFNREQSAETSFCLSRRVLCEASKVPPSERRRKPGLLRRKQVQ